MALALSLCELTGLRPSELMPRTVSEDDDDVEPITIVDDDDNDAQSESNSAPQNDATPSAAGTSAAGPSAAGSSAAGASTSASTKASVAASAPAATNIPSTPATSATGPIPATSTASASSALTASQGGASSSAQVTISANAGISAGSNADITLSASTTPSPPIVTASPTTAALPSFDPVPGDSTAIFTWNEPKIQYLGIRENDPFFKIVIHWRHGKDRRAGEFIPTEATSAGRRRAHRDPVRWLLIMGLWCDVFVDDVNLRLLLSEDPADRARSRIRAGQFVDVKENMKKLPVLLADCSTAQHGQCDDVNIQPLTYKRASRILKRLAEHPLANFSGLNWYDLRRSFATYMMSKVPKPILNLLMGHRRPSAITASTTYTADFPRLDLTAIRSCAAFDDPQAHSYAQQASGRRHGQGLHVALEKIGSQPELKRKIEHLHGLRSQLPKDVVHPNFMFEEHVEVPDEGEEVDPARKLKLDIAEAEIDILAYIRGQLGVMGVDLDALPDQQASTATAGEAPAPSTSSGQSSATASGSAPDEPVEMPDARTFDEQMELFHAVVNHGLSPLCDLTMCKTFAFVGKWLAKAELTKQRFCPTCFEQASKHGIAWDLATREQLEAFCRRHNIFSDHSVATKEIRNSIQLYVQGNGRMPLVGLDKDGLFALASHQSLAAEMNVIGNGGRSAALRLLIPRVGDHVPENFVVPILPKKPAKRKGKGKARKKNKKKRAKKVAQPQGSKGKGKAAETTSSSSQRTSSPSGSSHSGNNGPKYGVNTGSVHIPCNTTLEPSDLVGMGKWCLLPREVCGVKRIYLSAILWIHMQGHHMEFGRQRCWYCLEIIGENDTSHIIRCQHAYYQDKHEGEDKPVIVKDSERTPTLRHAVRLSQFTVYVSMCHGINAIVATPPEVAPSVIRAMRRSEGKKVVWNVDEHNKIGCPIVFCTADKTDVREMLRHLANVHQLDIVRSNGQWAHDLTEQEIRQCQSFTKDHKDLICFAAKVPPCP